MPLQNRVDPFSRFHAVDMRGLFTGNRGILHDPETQTIRKMSWATVGWVICTLEPLPGQQKRTRLMSKGKWTELFFLDEATGLAAGHRPCHACRREAAITFRDAVGTQKISDLNTLINTEMKPHLRVHAPVDRAVCKPSKLPDGAMFAIGDASYLKWQGAAYPWSFLGYGTPEKLPGAALRLTPTASCTALHNGYEPKLHPSLSA
ncbi:MAG: hypothetical protein QNI84_15615 [Henriciella sp.]|nr:hypothetical protein [Henriciella sp.]